MALIYLVILQVRARNKKHPELIYHIKDNLLPPGLDAMGIWEQIKLKTAPFQRIKNNVIRFEVSPPPEYVKDFTGKDWEKLWDDFLQEYDNYEHFDKKPERLIHPKPILQARYTAFGYIPRVKAESRICIVPLPEWMKTTASTTTT